MSKTTNKFSPLVRDRAARLALDNQGQHGSRWQAVLSISSKIGCAPQTLNDWGNNALICKPIPPSSSFSYSSMSQGTPGRGIPEQIA